MGDILGAIIFTAIIFIGLTYFSGVTDLREGFIEFGRDVNAVLIEIQEPKK